MHSMQKRRLAVFDQKLTFNIAGSGVEPVTDAPSAWAYRAEPPYWRCWRWTSGDDRTYDMADIVAARWGPKRRSKCEWYVADPRASAEVLRLMKFRTCPFCRTSMIEVDIYGSDGVVLLCTTCGYWGGRGTREEGLGPFNTRGVIGRYRLLKPLDANTTELLMSHIRRCPKAMHSLSPSRGERFVADLLRDLLNCEVRLVGRPKDNGVDIYLVNGDGRRCIVQVKWHRSSNGAETVSVVREVAGTVLARGVPSALIVSTRSHFSRAAIREASAVQQSPLLRTDAVRIHLADYNNILDMLELASRSFKATETTDLVPARYVFDGIYYRESEVDFE
jgi:hypothetical protein